MPDGLSGITDRIAVVEEQLRGQKELSERIQDKQHEQSRDQQKVVYRMDNAERRLDKAEGKIETHAQQNNRQDNRQDLTEQRLSGMEKQLGKIEENTEYTRKQSDDQRRQSRNQNIGFAFTMFMFFLSALFNWIF